jgi:hypothetical protein
VRHLVIEAGPVRHLVIEADPVRRPWQIRFQRKSYHTGNINHLLFRVVAV